MNDKTYTIEQLEEAFAALRRDIDTDYADTDLGSERGRFLINDIETDVLNYLKGMACWMVRQDEPAQQAYRQTAGVAEYGDDSDDRRDEDVYFYNGEVAAALDRWER